MKELLLLLCQYPYRESAGERISYLLESVSDFDLFVKLVNSHGIIALAAHNLKEAGLDKSLPPETMSVLENGLMKSIVRNIWLAERWNEVNKILSQAGISHILLKGMALEHTIYGSRGMRQMTDNDLLIRREEAASAWNILREKGFTISLPKSPLHMKIMLDSASHLPALYRDGYTVEIHTRLFDEIYPDNSFYSELFNNREEITIRGGKAFILKDEVHTKYLIKHFKRHLLGGECQLRTWQDLRMLDPENIPVFPDEFISEPDQKKKRKFRKAVYIENIRAVAPSKRLMFITGDIFPSVRWMKARYGCSSAGAILRYPHRMGKLLWII